jgi:hypothetical protein
VVVFDQFAPSEEYMAFAVVPLFATATKVPFPTVIDDHVSFTAFPSDQLNPSVEYIVLFVELLDTATYVPFPYVTADHGAG